MSITAQPTSSRKGVSWGAVENPGSATLTRHNPHVGSKSHPGVYIQWNLGMEEWRWLLDEEVGLIPPRWLVDEAWLEGCLDVRCAGLGRAAVWV